MANVRIATQEDEERIAATMTLAFSTDPLVRWALPEAHQHIDGFLPFVGAFAGKAYDHESAYVIGDFSGAALWLPPGVRPDDEAMARIFQEKVAEPQLGGLFSLFTQLADYHPHEPHWFLPIIGVDPAHQGNGYGSALMKHALLACDREQKLAYLESSNPANLSLYERHGFEVIAEVSEGGAPPTYPMLRKAQ